MLIGVGRGAYAQPTILSHHRRGYLDFYNEVWPHSSLGARTPQQAYLDHLPQRMAA
jgi:hypothetical protein